MTAFAHDDAPVTEDAARAAVARARRRERLRWAPAVVLLLAVSFALRVWGAKQGLPYAYNADENAHFVPKAIGLFGHGLNPHYFVNPPAYTYLLHVVFAVWFGGREGVSNSFAADPTDVFFVARIVAAACGTIAVWLLYLAGTKLFADRRVGFLAAGLLGVGFLPVFYSHLALNDVPTLAPICLALYGTAGIVRQGRLVDYLLAGAGLGLACATKYTGGIALLPILAAAGGWLVGRRRLRASTVIAGLAIAAVAALVAFLVFNPYALLDFTGFRDGLQHQTSVADDALGKLGLTEDNGLAYYLWTLTWGLGWVPAVAAGVGVVAARPRQLADRRRPGPGAAAVPALHGHPGALLRPLADAGLPDDLPAVGLRRAAGDRARRAPPARARPDADGARHRGALRAGADRLAAHRPGALAPRHAQPGPRVAGRQRAAQDQDRRRAGRSRRLGPGHRPPVAADQQRQPLGQVPDEPLEHRQRRLGDPGPRAPGQHRGLRAHALPGAGRPLRGAGLLLGRRRLHAARPGRGRARGRPARAGLLPRARAPRRHRLRRLAVPLRRARRSTSTSTGRSTSTRWPTTGRARRCGSTTSAVVDARRASARSRPILQGGAADRERPRASVARDRDRDARSRPRPPEPRRGRRGRQGRRGPGRGLARRVRRPARRGQRDRGLQRRRSDRRHHLRLAGAVLPPGQDAARAPRRSVARASPASSSPPTTRPRRPPAAASGSCATRA